MNEERRLHLDVSGLPKVTFGHGGLVWWGTIAFMVVEGFTLVLTVASYFYLRLNELEWPPGRTPLPELIIPTINTLLLLAIMWPMARASEAAKRFDKDATVRWLFIATALSGVAVVLRWFEILALNTSYDAHAYGSAAWAVIIFHTTLLAVDFFETGTLGILFRAGRARKKHYPDVSDAALYQNFLSISWVPLYLILYWGPRVF